MKAKHETVFRRPTTLQRQVAACDKAPSDTPGSRISRLASAVSRCSTCIARKFPIKSIPTIIGCRLPFEIFIAPGLGSATAEGTGTSRLAGTSAYENGVCLSFEQNVTSLLFLRRHQASVRRAALQTGSVQFGDIGAAASESAAAGDGTGAANWLFRARPAG